MDLGVELPVLHATSGFLDRFVIGWHETFGFAEQGRSSAPKDAFDVSIAHDGVEVWAMEPYGVHLGDVPIELCWSPVVPGRDGPFGLALRGGIEVPTGAASRGYGSGGVDVALGVVGEIRLPTVAFTGQLAMTEPSTPDALQRAGIDLREVWSFDLGAEIAVSDDFALLVGSGYESAALRTLGFSRAADDQWLLWIGMRQRTGPTSHVEIGFGEDLSRYVAPDFSAWLAVGIDL